VMEMAYISLAGLIAAYFGASAYQAAKRPTKK